MISAALGGLSVDRKGLLRAIIRHRHGRNGGARSNTNGGEPHFRYAPFAPEETERQRFDPQPGGTRGKTNSAYRWIAIHRLLLELGIVEHRDAIVNAYRQTKMKEAGGRDRLSDEQLAAIEDGAYEQWLFPDWKVYVRPKTDQIMWSHVLTKACTYGLKKLKIHRPGLSNYSARHFFKGMIDDVQGLSERSRKVIFGHSTKERLGRLWAQGDQRTAVQDRPAVDGPERSGVSPGFCCGQSARPSAVSCRWLRRGRPTSARETSDCRQFLQSEPSSINSRCRSLWMVCAEIRSFPPSQAFRQPASSWAPKGLVPYSPNWLNRLTEAERQSLPVRNFSRSLHDDSGRHVTAGHVFEQFVEDRTGRRIRGCQIGNVGFNPEERLIDWGHDKRIDIATFRITPEEIAEIGKSVVIGTDGAWPPPPDENGVVYFGGFRRALIN